MIAVATKFLLLVCIIIHHQVCRGFRIKYSRCSTLFMTATDASLSSSMNIPSASIPPSDSFSILRSTMTTMGISIERIDTIINKIKICGCISTEEIIAISKDFVDDGRPEALSELLCRDFELKPIEAHCLRSVITTLCKSSLLQREQGKNKKNALQPQSGGLQDESSHNQGELLNKKLSWKKVKVAKRDVQEEGSGGNYGLDQDSISVEMAMDLKAFENFMINVAVNSQDPPIRQATAEVYMRHCRLFLGWYQREMNGGSMLNNLQQVFKSKEKDSAEPIFLFIQWLRTTRKISASYEANILRGLTKLAKFRFAKESLADPSYGEKSYEDIPMIKELRKLHTFAGRQSKLSPRASDESKKWVSWVEFLDVVKGCKSQLDEQVASLEIAMNESKSKASGSGSGSGNGDGDSDIIKRKKRAVAEAFQKFLLLSFISNVPDRQRTFRELELEKTFFFDSTTNPACYVIKHSMQDYKTGKTYGERPPLVIAHELTPLIDEFIRIWRPILQPKSQKLFCQPRTGNPLTQDSVYQIVARTIYNHCGKRCNPHLLRDSLVTHVRDTDASEKELEALAIYMGHSIAMQRNSYDRRTLKQKVSPAVSLLRSLSSSSSQPPPTAQ